MAVMRETAWTSILGVMWVVLGGMQLVSGVGATLASVAMFGMSLLPQLRGLPPGFRVFLLVAPFASLVQCTLSLLLIYAVLRLVQQREHATRLLKVLCWLMITFTWCCALGLALVALTTGRRSADDAVVAMGIFLAAPLLMGAILSIPPLITIRILGIADGANGGQATD
jgi:L-asparagine transporter-like permease